MTAVHALSPGQVLDVHAALAARLVKPGDQVADYFRFFMADAWASNDDRARSMFYPVVRRDDTAVTLAHGRAMAAITGQALADAVTYQVTAEMTAAMRGVHDKTVEEITHIEQAELPCASGFAWLDGGWTMRDKGGGTYTVRALSWDYCGTWTRGTEYDLLPQPTLWPCVRITMWSDLDDDVAEGRLRAGYAAQIRAELGPLTVAHTAVIPFGLRFIPPDDATGRASADSMLGLVQLLWMFLQMEITATARPPVERHFRRRAQRSLKHHEVNVVLLRRIRGITEAEPGHREVDWGARWVVQGHWRHEHRPDPPHRGTDSGQRDSGGRALCAACGDRMSWIHPYIKGPDGKPLKVSRTLMKLAR